MVVREDIQVASVGFSPFPLRKVQTGWKVIRLSVVAEAYQTMAMGCMPSLHSLEASAKMRGRNWPEGQACGGEAEEITPVPFEQSEDHIQKFHGEGQDRSNESSVIITSSEEKGHTDCSLHWHCSCLHP